LPLTPSPAVGGPREENGGQSSPSLSLSGDEPTLEVSIIIPCRDEASTIGQCVQDAWAALDQWGYSGEVIVCDNASTDGSAAEAITAGARVVHQRIRGYGAACLRGMEVARGRHFVIADGDGTYDMSCLHRFIEPLRAGHELVLGTRRNGRIHKGAMQVGHLHVMEPAVTRLSRRFFNFNVSDVRCGLRSVTREAASRLRLEATGMDFASEMLVEAARAGLKAVEVPVEFRPRPNGAPRRSAADGWRVARALLLLSPTRLFTRPGLVLLSLGLIMQFLLVRGPIRLGSVTMDVAFVFAGGALALLGFQVLLLGVYAKTYALLNRVGPDDAGTPLRHWPWPQPLAANIFSISPSGSLLRSSAFL
jgi:glycosyltransferase involved in cell wall biosynthesis